MDGGYADFKPVFPLLLEDGEFGDKETDKKREKFILTKYGFSEFAAESEIENKVQGKVIKF